MTSLKAKKNWHDVFNAPGHSKYSLINKNNKKITDDSFARFAKSSKNSNHKSNDDFIHIESTEGKFIEKILKETRKKINKLNRLLKKLSR